MGAFFSVTYYPSLSPRLRLLFPPPLVELFPYERTEDSRHMWMLGDFSSAAAEVGDGGGRGSRRGRVGLSRLNNHQGRCEEVVCLWRMGGARRPGHREKKVRPREPGPRASPVPGDLPRSPHQPHTHIIAPSGGGGRQNSVSYLTPLKSGEKRFVGLGG